MGIKLSVDYFQDGKDLYERKQSCPNWDGTAPTSYIIDGWMQAAKEAGEPGYKCDCVSFYCPYHK